jgi:DNA repair photolyase
LKAIYEPKGKAREYGTLACNLYKGCGHGCTYCYAPAILRMDKEKFFNEPAPRKGIIEALKRGAKKLSEEYNRDIKHWKLYHNPENRFGNFGDKPRPAIPCVFLCFTCDPYQPINEKYQLTRQAIEILHSNEIAVNILTKGMITDFDLLAKRPDLSKVGVTLTFAKELEPNRPITNVLEGNLVSAKEYGINNWVSYEPIIFPNDVLKSIGSLDGFVDYFKLGKWNYDPRADKIDWHKFVNEAIELLEKLSCKYYIKEDLRKYIQGE